MPWRRSQQQADPGRFALTAAVFVSLFVLTGEPTAWAQSIDSCLVGTWEARSVEFALVQYKPLGGTGFRVAFSSDGTEIIDYSTMKPFLWTSAPNTDAQYWRGVATVRIFTDQSIAKIESIVDTSVEVKVSQVMPNFMPGWPGRAGPGVLGSAVRGITYACEGDSLKYDVLADGGQPWCSVELRRVTPETLAAEPVNVNGSTWLTATEIRDRDQDLEGVWSEEGTDSPFWWVSISPDGTFEDHPMPSRDPSRSSIQMKRSFGSLWQGRVYVCPRNGQCPNLCRWVQGSMKIGDNNLSGEVEWHDRKTKTDCSGLENEPDSDKFSMKRFVGVAFTPVVAGKYMELVGAPAVGNQSAQFAAAVRLTAHYDALAPVDVRAVADRGSITLIDKAKGIYRFSADQSGTFELRFQLTGSDGQVFHTDRVRIDIPGISGIGR